MYTKPLRLSVLFVSVFLIMWLISCNKNSTDGGDDGGNNNNNQQQTEQQIQEAAAAADDAALYMTTTTTTASAAASAVGGLLGKVNTPGDTLYTGCPTVVYERVQKILTIDYGSGCVGPAGMEHSGNIVLTGSLNQNALEFSTVFNDYTAQGCTVNGAVTYRMTMDSILVTIAGGSVVCGDSSVTLDASLSLTVDLNGTPGNVEDDIYTVDGFGTITTPGGTTYDFQIVNPLVMQAGCPYPVDGLMELTTETRVGTVTASVDYFPDNGQCDDVVVVTVNGVSQTIHLSNYR